MKHWKAVIFSLIFSAVLLSDYVTLYAHPKAPEHDKELEAVLFETGYSKYRSNEIKNNIKALEMASYLTIDQCMSKGEEQFNTLKRMRIGGLPSKFSDIDYIYVPGKSNTRISANTHRMYTHEGWDRNYTSKSAEIDKFWKTRRKILLGTVNSIFKFDKFPILFGYGEKCNSLAGIIYYVHILGDYDEADKYTKISKLPDVAGRVNANEDDMDYDMITSLKSYIEILFSEQKNTSDYKNLIKGLEDIEKKAGRLVQSTGGVNTDEEFEEYHQYSVEVLNILKEYMPKLLKNEEFFSVVFYPDEIN